MDPSDPHTNDDPSAHDAEAARGPKAKRRRVFYLIDLFFLGTVLKSYATTWVRQRMPMGDVPNPHFPGCTARQVDVHFSNVPGRIGCNDDVPWGWLLEHLGNSFGRANPSAFLNGTDLFFMALVIYAHLHVAYAIGRISYLAVQGRL